MGLPYRYALCERTKKVETSSAILVEEDHQAVIQGQRLKVIVHKDPFILEVWDENGQLLHKDIPDLAYRMDANGRRYHTSQIEVDDCFYGFGEKSGPINKAEKFMNMAPGDAMGYNPKETDSLYKHIPFYIRLNKTSRQAVGYFYHNTAECTFNMGREKRNYWHRYSTYCTDSGDIDLFLIAGPKITDIIEHYTDLTGKSAMLPKAALGYLGSSMYYPELEKDCDDATLISSKQQKKNKFQWTDFNYLRAIALFQLSKESSVVHLHGTIHDLKIRKTGLKK